jgi:hypothetical protein
MAALSDAVVIGIVLALVFSAAIYYVFTLFQQLEVKVNLLNNIILDLKKTNEASMMMFDQMDFAGASAAAAAAADEMPAFHMLHTPTPGQEMGDDKSASMKLDESDLAPVQQSPIVEKKVSDDLESVRSHNESSDSGNPLLNVNYESMSYKELQAEAKRKHITGIGKMNKTQLIDSLKKHDSGAELDVFAFDQTNGEFIAHLDDTIEVTL